MDEEDAGTSAVCGGAQGIGESLSCLGRGLSGGLAHKSADIGTARLKFASWNMGGFYGNNTKLECISKIGADIVCLTETHLCGNESNINLPGYMWFGHNRKSVHKKAWRGSGGVGVLVANYVLESFSVNILSKDFEDILCISLVHTATAETFGVCVAYLPPSNSSRGDKSLEFVNIMRMLVLKLHSFDNFMICGDFNARCSDKPDTQMLDQCDNIIPTRLSIDHSPVNSHGRTILEFMIDCDLCMLNGRFGENSNKYTCVSTKGASVVDYVFVPTKHFKMFDTFNIDYVSDLISQNQVDVVKFPSDHSVLSGSFCLQASHNATPNRNKSVNSLQTNTATTTQRLPKVQVPDDFLSNPASIEALSKHFQNGIDNIDQIYQSFCNIILKELPIKRKQTNRNRTRKKWWDKELSVLRSKLRKACKDWLRNKSNRVLKQEFVRVQHNFDRAVRSKKRKYIKWNKLQLLLKQKKNVKQFWRDIKKLGISANSKDSQIPLQVQLEDGNMSSERDVVLSKWMECFKALLNRDSSKSNVHPSPKTRIDVIPDSDQLNEPITREEVIQALKMAPTNKAVGIDSIDPSYLQHKSIINFLVYLFNYCFENGVCPSAWRKAVIFPIPKSGMSNRHIPGSYRGISLQSAVLKLYTSILNRRLMFLLETYEVISDLQNGFRPHRSCQDHILTLHNIVLNRKLKGNDTYACFVDFRKAFDSINRDLLWRKLHYME